VTEGGHIGCISEGSGAHYGACADDGCLIGAGCFLIVGGDDIGECIPYCDPEDLYDCPGSGACLSTFPTIEGDIGTCMEPDSCDPVENSGCEAGEMCWLVLDDGFSLCGEPGSLGAGDDCSTDLCGPGLICDNFWYSDDTCRELCWGDGDCTTGSCSYEVFTASFGMCLE
jgi:hypothetical protein